MTKALLAFLCATSMLIPLTARAGEVRNREVRQENRIYQGAHSGSLTTNEYDRLQSQEARLNEQRARDLHSGDGLSHREDVRLNREANHVSRDIYHDKHNRPHG